MTLHMFNMQQNLRQLVGKGELCHVDIRNFIMSVSKESFGFVTSG